MVDKYGDPSPWWYRYRAWMYLREAAITLMSYPQCGTSDSRG